MKTFHNLLCIACLLMVGLFFSPQTLAQDAEPFRERTFDTGSSAEFSAETSGSSVNVVGTSGDQVVVRMYAKDKNGKSYLSPDEVEENMGDYTLKMEHSGNEVNLVFKRKSSTGWNWNDQKMRVYFEVEVPTETETYFRTSGGSISIEAVDGDYDIATSGGSMNILNGSGDVEAKSSGGSFTMGGFEGDVSVKTSGGSVKVADLEGDLEVQTSGGSVRIDNIVGSIGAYTSGGSVRASLKEITDDLEFKTSGGSVTVTVPASVGLDLDLRGGRVRTDLKNFSGNIEKNEIEGELNGGGHSLTMQSSGGTISLEFSEE